MNLQKYKDNIRKKLENFNTHIQWNKYREWKNSYLLEFLSEEDKKNIRLISDKKIQELKGIYRYIYAEYEQEYINSEIKNENVTIGVDDMDDDDLREIEYNLRN